MIGKRDLFIVSVVVTVISGMLFMALWVGSSGLMDGNEAGIYGPDNLDGGTEELALDGTLIIPQDANVTVDITENETILVLENAPVYYNVTENTTNEPAWPGVEYQSMTDSNFIINGTVVIPQDDDITVNVTANETVIHFDNARVAYSVTENGTTDVYLDSIGTADNFNSITGAPSPQFFKVDNNSYEPTTDAGLGTTDSEDAYNFDSGDPVEAGIDTSSTEEGASQLIPNSTAVIFLISGVLSLIIFARLKTEDILTGVRKYIYVYIQENPGEHLASIRKEFELSSSSARHHLYVLEESDLIISYKAGKMKHYYLNKSGYSNYLAGNEYKAIISALKNDTSRNIVKYLLEHKNSNQKKISEIMQIHPSTVNWHARRLGDAGIIQSTREGKDVLYSVNSEIELEKIVQLIEGNSTLA